jgi:hypothetical protein
MRVRNIKTSGDRKSHVYDRNKTFDKQSGYFPFSGILLYKENEIR